ncbi:TRAP transporter large permease subunit, partial [Saliniramus sp.]|uniref:TRAP transporter large permease subunit n=1 Tax=Saliniramus sp. TaxID=2986772 RepID=UPI0039C8C411
MRLLQENEGRHESRWPVIALFAIVMGGIYGGIFTPTEAAGIGAFGAFLFALGRGALSWNGLVE